MTVWSWSSPTVIAGRAAELAGTPLVSREGGYAPTPTASCAPHTHLFEAMGVQSFADRARQELTATGATAHSRRNATLGLEGILRALATAGLRSARA